MSFLHIHSNGRVSTVFSTVWSPSVIRDHAFISNINEYHTKRLCHGGTCVNFPGSYQCACKVGNTAKDREKDHKKLQNIYKRPEGTIANTKLCQKHETSENESRLVTDVSLKGK